MKVFIDESGDHNLNLHTLDNNYNVFVLGAVCFTDENYKSFCEDFNLMKTKLFGASDYIIHTAEITRPNKASDSRTVLFNDQDFRRSFYSSVEQLFSTHDFEIIACCIKKKELVALYGGYADDPYIFGFDNILNRLLWRSKNELFDIFPEKRSSTEDNLLELNFLKSKITGTQFFTGSHISSRITTFKTITKQTNDCGSQLIDLAVSPIGRHFMGIKPRKEMNYRMLR